MPLVRKVMNLRTTRAVCLPKSWLDFFEKKHGVEIREVSMEVNGSLTIKPIISKNPSEKTVGGSQ